MYRHALALVCAFGCGRGDNRSVERRPATGSAQGSAALSDDQLLQRWYDAMENQLAADARHAATQRFANREEAEQALKSLTPVGFRPRPEYFQALYDAAGPRDVIARQLADYAAAHGDDMERRVAPVIEHLKPLMQQVFDNVQRQYPGQLPAPP